MSHPASTKSSRPRQMARVKPSLDKNLAAYMVAAGAAGVSMLGAQSAEAKIVFTPVYVDLSSHTSYLLDLNNDGVGDFLISHWFYGHADRLSIAQKASGNQIFAEGAALPAGVGIGPRGVFLNDALLAENASVSGISSFSFGPWKHADRRYLGLKLLVDGETHYGWARMTVNAKTGILANLTGYAYETVPNRPILSGKTSGPEEATTADPAAMLSPSQPPATLGMLARGAPSLAIWRRDDADGLISPRS